MLVVCRASRRIELRQRTVILGLVLGQLETAHPSQKVETNRSMVIVSTNLIDLDHEPVPLRSVRYSAAL